MMYFSWMFCKINSPAKHVILLGHAWHTWQLHIQTLIRIRNRSAKTCNVSDTNSPTILSIYVISSVSTVQPYLFFLSLSLYTYTVYIYIHTHIWCCVEFRSHFNVHRCKKKTVPLLSKTVCRKMTETCFSPPCLVPFEDPKRALNHLWPSTVRASITVRLCCAT